MNDRGIPEPSRQLRLRDADVLIYASTAALVGAAANRIQALIKRAASEKGRCSIALAGGSTPRSVYSRIAERAKGDDAWVGTPWDKVHFFFGDERCVPPDHPDSNYRMAKETLLSRGTFADANIHRIQAELPPAEAAKAYEDELRGFFGGAPAFDLCLLGIGGDGHTASLFLGTAALNAKSYVAATFVEKLNAHRVTLTYQALAVSDEIDFIVSGKEKADILRELLVEGADVPAAKVRAKGSLLWLVDEPAAAKL